MKFDHTVFLNAAHKRTVEYLNRWGGDPVKLADRLAELGTPEAVAAETKAAFGCTLDFATSDAFGKLMREQLRVYSKAIRTPFDLRKQLAGGVFIRSKTHADETLFNYLEETAEQKYLLDDVGAELSGVTTRETHSFTFELNNATIKRTVYFKEGSERVPYGIIYACRIAEGNSIRYGFAGYIGKCHVFVGSVEDLDSLLLRWHYTYFMVALSYPTSMEFDWIKSNVIRGPITVSDWELRIDNQTMKVGINASQTFRTEAETSDVEAQKAFCLKIDCLRAQERAIHKGDVIAFTTGSSSGGDRA